jgi:hypothetical protein
VLRIREVSGSNTCLDLSQARNALPEHYIKLVHDCFVHIFLKLPVAEIIMNKIIMNSTVQEYLKADYDTFNLNVCIEK